MMIAYDLQCDAGHSFEGWFEDEKAYNGQTRKGMLSCPICNSSAVRRVPSTFAIKTTPRVAGSSAGGPKIDKARLEQKIVEFVDQNFDNVGSEFAKEALKIHYGASEPRNIRGTSTEAEEKVLKQEGIGFFKIPLPAPQQNTDS
ncbi:MAG: DUF1178 family protein [Pseudomonadota bacterium]